MTKRQPAKPKPKETSAAATSGPAADALAVYVGRTLAELLNQKDELQKRLAEVEVQITRASGELSTRIGKYLSKNIRRLAPRRARAVKKMPKRTRRPMPAHGPDSESAKAHVVEKSTATTERMQTAAPRRSAPRATRRG
jgi:hypothetical protein